MMSLSLLHHAPDDVISHLMERGAAIPREVDAVIIGGGIMGASTCWYLAQSGLKVVLVERSRVASQQSGRNWGFVRSLYRDPKELELARSALSIWPTLTSRLGHETGWRQEGCVFLSSSSEEHSAYEAWLREVGELVSDTRMLRPDETRSRLPRLKNAPYGAIIAESDGQAEPVLTTVAFARAATEAGATIIEDCGVKAIETSAGSVSGVWTEHGFIRSKTIICTAGAQSWQLLQGLAPRLPQKAVRSTVSLTAPVEDLNLPCFVGAGLGLRQRADGSCIMATDSGTDIDITLDSFRSSSFFIGEVLRNRKSFSLRFGHPFWEDLHRRLFTSRSERAYMPRDPHIAANQSRVVATRELFSKLFDIPAPTIVKSWAGNIDVMPDALPVIDANLPVGGLVIATGFSGHGFGLGPAVGKVISDVINGRSSAVNLAPFSSGRFEKGFYSRPYSSI